MKKYGNIQTSYVQRLLETSEMKICARISEYRNQLICKKGRSMIKERKAIEY